MTLFGESSEDQRDYGFAFGAFKGTTYLGSVLAARGLLSPLDAKEFRRQLLDGIEIVPAAHLSPDGRAAIEATLDGIDGLATRNFRPGKADE